MDKKTQGKSNGLPPAFTHTVQCGCDLGSFHPLRYFRHLALKPNISCSMGKAWKEHCSVPKHGEEVYRQVLHSAAEGRNISDSLRQIQLDLGRTYPDEAYFGEGRPGRAALERVLTGFSKYDPHLGYVQGMNFIAGALLWHCSEPDAFWLFVSLMEDFNLRENYMASLPGLSKHCQIISLLLMEYLPRLHLHFSEHRVIAEMFATDWCLTLFGSLVPVQDMGQFLGRFLGDGWAFFYKVVVEILRRLEERLLKCRDVADILTPLKPVHRSQKHWREFLVLLEQGSEQLDWQQIFQQSEILQLDSASIGQLLTSFGVDRAVYTQP